MESRYIVAFALIASLLLTSAVPVSAASLAVAGEHTTPSEFESGALDNVQVTGSGTGGSVEYNASFNDTFTGGLSEYTYVAGSGAADFTTTANDRVSADQTATGWAALLRTDAAATDYRVESTFEIETDANGISQQGLITSWINSSNFVRIGLYNNGNELRIRETVGGATTLHSTAATISADTNYTVVAEKTNQSLTVTVTAPDGSTVATDTITLDPVLDQSGQVGLNAEAGSGAVAKWSYLSLTTSSDTGSYTSQPFTVDDPEEGRVDLALTNASAIVTWQSDADGDGVWTNITQTTYTTGGAKTADLSGATGDTYRVQVTFERTGANPTARLDRDAIYFTNHAPSASNLQPSDGVKLTSSSTTFSVDVTDAEFPTAQGESVTATLEIDGTQAYQETVTSNQTVSTTETLSEGGDHTYHWVLNDSYGESTTTATKTVTVPAELRILNESAPSNLVDNATVEIRMYANETGNVQVFTRNTSDGTVNMTGIPADVPFVVVADADGYYSRRIFVPSLYETQSIFLLPDTKQVSDTIFSIDDYTGDYPSDDTVLLVQRSLNGSYQTVLGDYFGATGEFPAQLRYNVRHRLVLYNVETGETRRVGTYTPLTSSTQTVVVTPKGVTTVQGEPPSVVLHPQLRRLPALSGTTISMTVRGGSMDLQYWEYTISLKNLTSGNVTPINSQIVDDAGSETYNLNLENKSDHVVLVNVTWETNNGISATETYEIAISKALTNDQSLLETIGDLANLSPAGNARAAFTGFLAMLITVLVVAAIGSIQPSQEIAGIAGILTLTGFAVMDFGITYDVVFVASVGFLAFTSIRRGL